MIILPFTLIDVMSGLAGSSENWAVHGRPALSFQLTSAASAVELTAIEPGPGPLISNGTTAAGAANAHPTRTTINLMLIPLLLPDLKQLEMQGSHAPGPEFELPEIIHHTTTLFTRHRRRKLLRQRKTSHLLMPK
jgi:hypothetical protein